jgi:hypothetical protein
MIPIGAPHLITQTIALRGWSQLTNKALLPLSLFNLINYKARSQLIAMPFTKGGRETKCQGADKRILFDWQRLQ